MKYLINLTNSQTLNNIAAQNGGAEIPAITMNGGGNIDYINDDYILIAYTFTWRDSFIEEDGNTTRTWRYGLFDDPDDGKTKYVLCDVAAKRLILLADGESYTKILKIDKNIFNSSSGLSLYNAYSIHNQLQSAPSFFNPDYVEYYIPGIKHGCYSWEENVQYMIEHPWETNTLTLDPYSKGDDETWEEAEARKKQEQLDAFNALTDEEKYNIADTKLKQKSGTYMGACTCYPNYEDIRKYCLICLQGVWHDPGNSSVINQSYRNSELVSAINFLTSNIQEIKLYNCSSYYNCEKLTFNDNIETLNGFSGSSGTFKEIHLPKNLKSLGTSSFSYIKAKRLYETIEDVPTLTIDFGDELESIPDSVFNNGNMINIHMKLPKKLKTIGSSAFHWYNSDEQLVIPASVESIGIGTSNNIAFCPATTGSGESFRVTHIPSVKFEGAIPPTMAIVSGNTPSGYCQDFAYEYDETTKYSYVNSYNQTMWTADLVEAAYPIYIPRGSKSAYMTALPYCKEERFIEYDPE